MVSSGFATLAKVILQNFDLILGPIVGLFYPLCESVRAIETKSPEDDQQWLTYWILYSMITLFELTFAKAIEWIPIWSYVKLIVTCWLVLPHFNGAAYVYLNLVRPYIIKREAINIWYLPRFGKQDDILTAARKYIAEHGTADFEGIIKEARRGSMSGKKL